MTSYQRLEIFLANLPKQLVSKLVETEEVKDLLVHNASVEFQNLSECACAGHGTFNRMKNQRRQEAENSIVHQAADRFKQKNIPLTFLSFGSGGLLQDYIICGKLLQLGYSLDIVLIEPNILRYKKALAQFKELGRAAREKKLSFTVTEFGNIREYLEQYPDKKLDVAHAIDFDHTTEEFEAYAMIYHQLSAKGFFYTTFVKGNLIFDAVSKFPRVIRVEANFAPLTQFIKLPDYCRQIDPKHSAETKVAVQSGTHLPDVAVKHILQYRGFFENGGLIDNQAINAIQIEGAKLQKDWQKKVAMAIRINYLQRKGLPLDNELTQFAKTIR